jgi:hypothetical protein
MGIQYFVMLDNQDGKLIQPLLDEDGMDVALFDTEHDAREAAQANAVGSHFGYEIFERGNGNL